MFNKRNKNLLILSYFFPPCNRVGGRRWAKFAKNLRKDNFNVFVICVDIPFEGHCPWEKDIIGFEKQITRLPYIEHRPFFRTNMAPADVVGKIRYRLSKLTYAFMSKIKDGSPFDISRKYGTAVRDVAQRLINENNVETVVVTGGPFHWCYDCMQLKKQFPNLKFLLDLRDYWSGGLLDRNLTEKQRREELLKEYYCIKNSSVVFTPAERIAKYLEEQYKDEAYKIKTLPHAYDAEELPISTEVTLNEPVLSLAYGGILYQFLDATIDKLIELLLTMIHRGINVRLDIYTFTFDYIDKFKKAGLSSIVHYHKPIPPLDLFTKFKRTDYLLQLRTNYSDEQHFKSTKFYELIALRKPVIYFGPEGDISEFLEKNRLGYSANIPLLELADKLVQNKLKKDIPDTTFEIEGYEYKNVTQELEKYL